MKRCSICQNKTFSLYDDETYFYICEQCVKDKKDWVNVTPTRDVKADKIKENLTNKNYWWKKK